MQGLSGITSHIPLKVPPQGPFRIFLGQVIGHTYSISPRTQLPQALHPKSGFLMDSSKLSSARAAAGRSSTHRRTDARDLRSALSSCLTGNSLAAVSSNFGKVPSGFGA